MRKLSPGFIATSLALALASGGALAQVARSATTPPAANASATTGASTATASTTTPTVSSGSTATASTTAPGETNGLSGVDVTAPEPATASGTNGLQPGVIIPIIPGVAIAADPAVNASGERGVTGNAGAPSVPPTATPTPLFELTARQGAAKEAARRARGDEPRVYGIAPRTERDLTRQMPDDPVIRY